MKTNEFHIHTYIRRQHTHTAKEMGDDYKKNLQSRFALKRMFGLRLHRQTSVKSVVTFIFKDSDLHFQVQSSKVSLFLQFGWLKSVIFGKCLQGLSLLNYSQICNVLDFHLQGRILWISHVLQYLQNGLTSKRHFWQLNIRWPWHSRWRSNVGNFYDCWNGKRLDLQP